MTKNKFLMILAMLSTLFLIFGCSNDKENKQINFDVVTSEKTLPGSFYDDDNKNYIVEKAITQTEFEEVWRLYQFEKDFPTVDFEAEDVIFVGLQESSSCPYEVDNEHIAFDLNSQSIALTLPKQNGPCFLDATPKTFVIKIDKNTSKDIKNVVILKDETEKSIPFD